MKTTTLRIAVALMATFGLLGAATAADLKIAVVDMELIMKAYPETQSSRKVLEDQLTQFEQEQKDLLEERNKLEEQFREAGQQAQSMALSDDAREKHRVIAEGHLESLREMEREIRETTNMRRKQLNDRQLRMRSRIVKKLREVIGAYARGQNITIVLDSAVPGTGNAPESVVYSADHLDITENILGLIKLTADGTEKE